MGRDQWRDRQQVGTSSLIFLSFVEILAMITAYCNKVYLLNCEKFQKDNHQTCRLAVRQVSMKFF